MNNKVVIVTGSSSGIGRATAIYFAKKGSKVIITGRNEAKLNETKALCSNSSQNNVAVVIGDLNDDRVRKTIVETAVNTFGKIDILVNNSGIALLNNLQTLTENDFDKIMNTNLKSAIFLTQLCVPYLIAQQGCIVNVSSRSGIRAQSKMTAYSISKAALDQFTRCLAIELAPKKVRVNSINPGFVPTDICINNNLCSSQEENEQFWKNGESECLLNRTGKPEEIADAIGFLASDQASFITGATFSVDGGLKLV